MEKEFVTYQQALKLKTLGFDEECIKYQYKSENPSKESILKNLTDEDYIGIPLKSQAFRWFRKEYGYWSYLKEATKGTCRFYIEKFDEKFFNSDIIDTYEEAESACLDKLIELAEGIES